MRKSLFIPLALAGLAMAATSYAKSSADLQKEYDEVRQIALKDPKVQAAYAKYNERLNDRILEIDPSLKPIVDRESQHPQTAVAVRETKPEHHAAPAATPEASAHEHVIAKGETLSSIAGHYHVTVAALKSANQITDERKLKIGQKLTIPAAAQPKKAQPASEAEPKSDDSWWSQMKKDL